MWYIKKDERAVAGQARYFPMGIRSAHAATALNDRIRPKRILLEFDHFPHLVREGGHGGPEETVKEIV